METLECVGIILCTVKLATNKRRNFLLRTISGRSGMFPLAILVVFLLLAPVAAILLLISVLLTSCPQLSLFCRAI